MALVLMLIISAGNGGGYRHTDAVLGGLSQGSFTGMASTDGRTLRNAFEWTLAALLGGGIGVALTGVFNGFGGKLGFQAFLSGLPIVAWHALADAVARRRRAAARGGTAHDDQHDAPRSDLTGIVSRSAASTPAGLSAPHAGRTHVQVVSLAAEERT